ncbi:hypothetical protein DM860_006604 [Cuscuta australis]|uniref:Uncharacterized protein n=1 Tax=Cuscuta australis TaxID=267555 RepID=A0A328D545_9ASTE|nr:hypothetical protein DM860_006604 [Cuscuta australis]
MDCDVGKEVGGCEKRSGSPIIADPASKKPRSELVEESIVETGYLIAEIDKESIVKDDDELVEIDEFHCPMPNEEEEKHLLRRIDERLLFELGLKWIVYRLMVGKDETEKFIPSVESLKNDYNEGQNSLIDLFEGPPKFVSKS